EYFRKIGRNADTKSVSEKDAFTVDDLLTIAPSATYQDSDPGGAFRLQSYRLLRVVLQANSKALRQYVSALDREDGRDAKLELDENDLTNAFARYVEPALPMPSSSPAVKSGTADSALLAVHRGDLLLAADKNYDAGKYYNGNSSEARAARAILTRFSRPP